MQKKKYKNFIANITMTTNPPDSPNNPFKLIEDPPGTAPPHIKERVTASYSLFTKVFEVVDLYLATFFKTFIGILTLNNQSTSNKTTINTETNQVPATHKDETDAS